MNKPVNQALLEIASYARVTQLIKLVGYHGDQLTIPIIERELSTLETLCFNNNLYLLIHQNNPQRITNGLITQSNLITKNMLDKSYKEALVNHQVDARTILYLKEIRVYHYSALRLLLSRNVSYESIYIETEMVVHLAQNLTLLKFQLLNRGLEVREGTLP